ncbi:hypothetical protein Dimus_020575 [Dionaea muscipula]
MFCTAEIFAYLEDTLKLTPENMVDLAAASDELAEMHQQVISSSLLALATLLDASGGGQSEKSTEDMTDEPKHVLEARALAISLAEKLFSSQKFFLDFLRAQGPSVRSATYSLLSSYIRNVPQVYSEGDMKTLAPAILGAFHEVHPLCHTAMWEAILLFSKRFPGAWSYVNIQKIVFNRLWHFLRNGCFGSQQVSYPCLVLFLDNLPPERIAAEKVFDDFFQNLWAGRNLSHPSKADRAAFFQALRECFIWVSHNASRYFNGVDGTCLLQISLVKNILVKLFWHDFLFYAGSQHDYGVSSGKPGAVSEDSSQLLLENTLDLKNLSGYLQEMGQCLIEIISAVLSFRHQLLAPFYEAFHDNCLQAFQQADQLKRTDNLVKIIKFMYLLEQHAVQKAETWPFDYLVGPLLERCFPLIRLLDSPDSLKFLSVVISIFGPRRVIERLPIGDEAIAARVPVYGDGEVALQHFCQVFERTFIPWCFSGDDVSATARLDLLLALLDYDCFSEQWDDIVSYATNEGDFGFVSKSQITRLAKLLEKARRIILDRRLKLDGQNQSEKWHHKLLDTAAISIMHSVSTSGNSESQFLRAVLGCSRETEHVSFLSNSAITHIYHEVLKTLAAFLKASQFSWVWKWGSLVCDEVNISVLELKSFADVSKMAHFALEILDAGFFCLKSHYQEHSLVSGIAASIFIIDWECSLTTASGDESLKENFNRLEFGKSMHAFCEKIGNQFWRSCTSQSRGTIANILFRFVRSSIVEADELNVDILISSCIQWVVDAIKCVCLDQYEEQNALDLLLSYDDQWPLWVKPDCNSNKMQIKWNVATVSPDLQVRVSKTRILMQY